VVSRNECPGSLVGSIWRDREILGKFAENLPN
jgi:hypothetical protein